MARFNLDDYVPVEERISVFYENHPNGRIVTDLTRLEPPLCVVRAEVYRDHDSEKPWATGYAHEIEGEGHVNKTSYVENCETSAIGRALANAGYHGRRDGAPRPSREEMQKVERMGSTPASGSFDLSEEVPKGKHKGKSWAELAVTEPSYVKYVLDKWTDLSAEAREKLQAALEGEKASATDVVKLQDALNRAAAIPVIDLDQAAKIEEIIDEADKDMVAKALVRLEKLIAEKKAQA